MQQLVKKTGGVIIIADAFDHQIFQRSLQKLFEKDEKGDLKMAFNATIELIVCFSFHFFKRCYTSSRFLLIFLNFFMSFI
jgi:hypothetical protein